MDQFVFPLAELVSLIKAGRSNARPLLLEYFQRAFPRLDINEVEVRQSPLSLNSINGIVSSVSGRYFFKMHSEEGEVESLALLNGSEYYQAQQLADVGYPVISPLCVVGEPGRQAVLYPEISAPTAFDYLREAELSPERSERQNRWNIYLRAERKLAEKQCEVMLRTLGQSPPVLAESAPVCPVSRATASLHQLFYHRLVSGHVEGSRLSRFYENSEFDFRRGVSGELDAISWRDILPLRWRINGKLYSDSLGEILESAKLLLHPENPALQTCVIGHGDDHNGNKFLIDDELYLFDPAFAGWQPALLSFVKATAHNVFLHPHWFYNPESARPLTCVSISGDEICIEHDFELSVVAPERLALLELYRSTVWTPLLDELHERRVLGSDWSILVSRALACCVLLTRNLLAQHRGRPELLWLALSRAVELGSTPSLFDQRRPS